MLRLTIQARPCGYAWEYGGILLIKTTKTGTIPGNDQNMEIKDNYNLKAYNSFGIDARTKKFASFQNLDELKECLHAYPLENKFILGGGSNILLTKDFDGFCLKNEMKGIELINEDDTYYYVKAAAGEVWHQFVLHCINKQYAGLENLSLIPGCVGASPMQNIGAYGVEIKDVFYALEALHMKDLVLRTFKLDDCQFGYRESIFKSRLKGEYIILNVHYRLRKKPVFHLNYGAIQAALEQMGVSSPTINDVSKAVIQIRESKLPDPAKIGNAGSFFKNPTIGNHSFQELRRQFPAIVGYQLEDEQNTKVAAGWLIENCGWKGYRKNNYGVHADQALVLVNYGGASGQQILDLSTAIIQSVQDKFNISLEREVNIL